MRYDWPNNTVRQIHLDFHTPPWAEGIGRRFDVDDFGRTLRDAHVQVVAAFAKCHHGMSYFNDAVGTRHPGMEIDLFGGILEACRKYGIVCEAYFSMNVDEAVADAHPEWLALQCDGTPIDSQVLEDGHELYWRWICDNRGRYIEDFFFPHVAAFLKEYDVDGLWFDMAGYLPGTCFCEQCVDGMKRAGLDAEDEDDHDWWNALTIQRVYDQARRVVDEIRPGVTLLRFPIHFGNARLYERLAAQFEVEALPGQVGPFMQPSIIRYARNFRLPVAGMTSRFRGNWGEFGTLRGFHQQTVEAALSLALGAKTIVGDHLHDDGRLLKEAYDDIGATFAYVKEREALCVGAEPVPCAAVMSAASRGERMMSADLDDLFGAAKVLRECHVPYNVVDDRLPLDEYGLVVVPGFKHPVSPATAQKLSDAVAQGATAILLGTGVESAALAELAGVSCQSRSEYSAAYMRSTDPALQAAVGEMAVWVDARPTVVRTTSADVLAEVCHPLCERGPERFYGHYHAPAREDASSPAVTLRRVGKGSVVYVAFPLLRYYLRSGNILVRRFLDALLAMAYPPAARPLEVSAPLSSEVTVMRKDGKTLIHFVDWHQSRSMAGVEPLAEEFPTWRDIAVRVKALGDNVRLYPEGTPLTSAREGDSIRFTLGELTMHQIVAIG